MSVTQWQNLEQTWAKEVARANEFFGAASFEEAYRHYIKALLAAEVLLEEVTAVPSGAPKVPGMYFIACISLATTYWHMKDLRNAADYFLYCTYQLKKVADGPENDPVVKQTAAAYWLKSLELYTGFSKAANVSMPADLDKSHTYHQIQKLKELFAFGDEKNN